MKNPLQKRFSFALNQLTGMKLLSGRTTDVLLFDSSAAASDIAFMLGGQWDGCNGADLRGAILDEATLSRANLTGAKLTQGQLPS